MFKQIKDIINQKVMPTVEDKPKGMATIVDLEPPFNPLNEFENETNQQSFKD